MDKRGQIAIFIIIGMIIVFLAFIFSSVVDTKIIKNDVDTSSIKQYTELCLASTLQRGLYEVGYSDRWLLEQYISSELKNCTSRFDNFEEFQVDEGDVSSAISIIGDDEKIILKVNYPLGIIKDDVKSSLSDFEIEYPLIRKEMLPIENGVVSQQVIVLSPDKNARLVIQQGTKVLDYNGNPAEYIIIAMKDVNEYDSYYGNMLRKIVYDFQLDGTTFDKPASLSITYDLSSLPRGIDSSQIQISYFDRGAWVPMDTIINGASYVVSSKVNHFSSYAFTYTPAANRIYDGTWFIQRTSSDNINQVFSLGSHLPLQGDYDGDGITDLATYYGPKFLGNPCGDVGAWFFFNMSNVSEGPKRYRECFGADLDSMPAPADYDGDGITDIAYYDVANGIWHIKQGNSERTESFGDNMSIPAPADYDGDGKADLALYNGGKWLIKRSSDNQVINANFGPAEESPGRGVFDFNMDSAPSYMENWAKIGWFDYKVCPADYDEDGKADLCVYSKGVWTIKTADRQIVKVYGNNLGVPANRTLPVPGDYDGDNITDVAVYYMSEVPGEGLWSIWDHLSFSERFGNDQTIGVPGDYDGDNITDLAVYYKGNWTMMTINRISNALFGDSGMIPIPGDYDGDGRADLIVYDRTEFKWFISTQNGPLERIFGWEGVKPFVKDTDGDGKDELWVYDIDLKKQDCKDGYGNIFPGWYSHDNPSNVVYCAGYSETRPFGIDLNGDKREGWGLYYKDISYSSGGSSIDEIGAEEFVSANSYARAVDIAVDTKNQPHIATEKNSVGGRLNAYHKIGDIWYKQEPVMSNPFEGVPGIRVDSKDRAWISGTFLSGYGSYINLGGRKCCNSVSLFTNVDEDASPSKAWGPINVNSGFVSHIAIDPYYPDNAFLLGDFIAKYDSNGGAQRIDGFNVNGGEKMAIEIAPREGQPGVIHVASEWSYQNSLRVAQGQGLLKWSPGNGDDHAYPDVGIDLERPEVAYILAPTRTSLDINIWDGTRLLFPENNPYAIAGASGLGGNGVGMGRYSAQWAPAKNGGAFLCFSGTDGNIKIKYISAEGLDSFGEAVTIGPGRQCNIATDSEGSIHLVYNNGGMKYRRITTG